MTSYPEAPACIPDLALELVPVKAGGFCLVLNSEGQAHTLAQVFPLPGLSEDEIRQQALALAAAFVLFHANDRLIENAQPDNWDGDEDDPDGAAAWRGAFRAMLAAKGLPIPPSVREPPNPA